MLSLSPLPVSVVWLFGLSARSHKKYFQETWMDGGSQSKMDLIKLLVWIQIKGPIQDFFSLAFKIARWSFFLTFCKISQVIMHGYGWDESCILK